MSGRSVKGPGGLLLEGDERKEGCGGGKQPKEEWEERRAGPLSGWSPLPGAAAEASTDTCLQTPAAEPGRTGAHHFCQVCRVK